MPFIKVHSYKQEVIDILISDSLNFIEEDHLFQFSDVLSASESISYAWFHYVFQKVSANPYINTNFSESSNVKHFISSSKLILSKLSSLIQETIQDSNTIYIDSFVSIHYRNFEKDVTDLVRKCFFLPNVSDTQAVIIVDYQSHPGLFYYENNHFYPLEEKNHYEMESEILSFLIHSIPNSITISYKYGKVSEEFLSLLRELFPGTVHERLLQKKLI